MNVIYRILMVLAVLTLSSAWSFEVLAQTGPVIANVSRVKHDANVSRGGEALFLRKDMALFHGDVITTGREARLEVSFIDGTTLTLGEQSSITLDSFVFDPQGIENKLAVSVAQGAFLFVSGKMGKQPERDMSVSTQFATIGIRGTTFWGGSLDNPLDVLLLDGVIEVRSPGGAITLDAPGKGTTIKAPGQQPTAPSIWSEEKRNRAFATVAFE